MKKWMVLVALCMLSMVIFLEKTEAVSDITTVQVVVQGGGLSILAPNTNVDFGTVAIDGSVKSVSAPLGTLSVMDLTGTGNGWNVTVAATQFSNGTNTMPMNSLKLLGVQSITPNGTTSPSPTIVGAGNYTLDNGSANKILSASSNQGMGRYNVDFLPNAMKFTIDTNLVKTSASPYSSTITWTMVTGP